MNSTIAPIQPTKTLELINPIDENHLSNKNKEFIAGGNLSLDPKQIKLELIIVQKAQVVAQIAECLSLMSSTQSTNYVTKASVKNAFEDNNNKIRRLDVVNKLFLFNWISSLIVPFLVKDFKIIIYPVFSSIMLFVGFRASRALLEKRQTLSVLIQSRNNLQIFELIYKFFNTHANRSSLEPHVDPTSGAFLDYFFLENKLDQKRLDQFFHHLENYEKAFFQPLLLSQRHSSHKVQEYKICFEECFNRQKQLINNDFFDGLIF